MTTTPEPTQPSRPERRHEVNITISADSWNDVIGALRHLEFIFHSEGPGHNLTSGGYSSSITAIDKTNEDVTHDSYFEKLNEWLENRKI